LKNLSCTDGKVAHAGKCLDTYISTYNSYCSIKGKVKPCKENAYDHLNPQKNSWTYMDQSGKNVFNGDAKQVKSVPPLFIKASYHRTIFSWNEQHG